MKPKHLLKFLAKACCYAQAHIDDADAWDVTPGNRETLLQCVSYQVACFLAQNTQLGGNGVEWECVLGPLIKHPMKSEKRWRKIIQKLADELGGWKTPTKKP